MAFTFSTRPYFLAPCNITKDGKWGITCQNSLKQAQVPTTMYVVSIHVRGFEDPLYTRIFVCNCMCHLSYLERVICLLDCMLSILLIMILAFSLVTQLKLNQYQLHHTRK